MTHKGIAEALKRLETSSDRLEYLTDRIKERDLNIYEALEGGMVGIWEWNSQTDTLFWDHRMFKLFGVNTSSFNNDYNSFIECVHPDDRDAVNDAIQSTLAGGPSYAYTYRVKSKDGWKRISARGGLVKDDSGEVKGVSGICIEELPVSNG